MPHSWVRVGKKLLVPISTLSMREGVSQIWLTVALAWRKMLTKPTVLVQVALGKEPLTNVSNCFTSLQITL